MLGSGVLRGQAYSWQERPFLEAFAAPVLTPYIFPGVLQASIPYLLGAICQLPLQAGFPVLPPV